MEDSSKIALWIRSNAIADEYNIEIRLQNNFYLKHERYGCLGVINTVEGLYHFMCGLQLGNDTLYLKKKEDGNA